MPEGDTLWRVANRLSPVLVGRRVSSIRLASPALVSAARRHRVAGSTIVAVEARGKHLLVRFSTGVGVGNIYKSETLFLCGVDPFAPVAALDGAALRRIVDTAHDLMRRSVVAPASLTARGSRR